MSLRKYAAVDAKVYKPQLVVPQQSLSKFGSFSFKPRPGYIYPRVRAISARINKNFDGFPSVELQKAAHTFKGRPVFVNHNNQDEQRTRGVILASQYHGLADDPHITILPEVDALTFPDLAQDIIKGDMDSVSMGCDVDNSTCSFCGNVATTAEQFCDHILNNKGQELTKLVNGQPKRILVYEICRGLNFFEISFVFDPADETAVMQELVVPEGVKMASTFGGPDHDGLTGMPFRSYTSNATTTSGLTTVSNFHLSYGEMIAPPKVDTLRDDNVCPQCGSDFNGIECENCGYITPPEELQDPDTQEAGKLRDGDEQDGENGDLDYFGDEGDSDDEDEDDQSPEDEDGQEEDEPDPYNLYRGQPRKEGNVSRGTAVQANVGQALAQRRLAEAQRRLRTLAEFNDDDSASDDPTSPGQYSEMEEGVDTGENVASKPPADEAPVGGSTEAEAAPDLSTTVDNLNQNRPLDGFGEREDIMTPVTASKKKPAIRRRAEDLTNDGVASQDTEQQDLEAPVANQVDDRSIEGQYSGWDNNAQNMPQNGGDLDGTEAMVPDGRGSTPMQTGAAKKEAMVLKAASASQVYQLADLYTELGLVPHEQRYAAIAQIEKMPAIVATHTIKVLARVKEVFSTQMPQGRVARTASAIPTLGKSASAGRVPSMARQAENRRLASNAEDTLLFIH